MTRPQLNLIIFGIMLSLFLASVEGTIVATTMPSIVGQLGGLSIYSWVFSIYMLASTTTVPLYGKLSDLYGRKRLYLISMSLFLGGSVLCAQSHSMQQLVIFRLVQGLGAGGILPLAFTIIGELFTLEQRARLQGLFSGVWGVSSIIGPLIGGYLVDQISWPWVFYINLPIGLIAAGLVWIAWRDTQPHEKAQVLVDFPGAVCLTLGALCLLLGLNELSTPRGCALILGAAGLLTLLWWVERRAADPILPLFLFRDRLFAVTILHGIFAGWAMFGSLSFVPLFVQAVLGTSATQAGITLTPMSLSWTLASILGSNLLLKMGYRTLALFGMGMLSLGTFMMSTIGINTSPLTIMVYTGMMGIGMGLSVPAFLIAVQSTVDKKDMGAATSTITFSRSIGGTIGVSVMGAFLSTRLASLLVSAGLDPAAVPLNNLLDPLARASTSLAGPLQQALGTSIANMFVISFAAALVGFFVVPFAPGGRIAQLIHQRPVKRSEH